MKKKSNFPKSVTILGRKFKVKIVTLAVMNKSYETPAAALVNFDTRTILILNSLSDYDKMLCLFHEIGHISQVVNGVDQVISAELKEILCETNANAFMDLIYGKIT